MDQDRQAARIALGALDPRSSFERMLPEGGTRVVKIFLHFTPEEHYAAWAPG
jgi:hypothetical protein